MQPLLDSFKIQPQILLLNGILFLILVQILNLAFWKPVLRQLDRRREEIAPLPAGGVHHVYVDGGITIQRFLRAGLVQRLIITRVPVLIGDGIPLFGSLPRDVRLRHVATQHYASGLVKTEYFVSV